MLSRRFGSADEVAKGGFNTLLDPIFWDTFVFSMHIIVEYHDHLLNHLSSSKSCDMHVAFKLALAKIIQRKHGI